MRRFMGSLPVLKKRMLLVPRAENNDARETNQAGAIGPVQLTVWLGFLLRLGGPGFLLGRILGSSLAK
jgi:hypothetical protein